MELKIPEIANIWPIIIIVKYIAFLLTKLSEQSVKMTSPPEIEDFEGIVD